MKVKIISWEHAWKILEYQSCNDWLTVDWIVTVFRITQVAFDLDGMIRMCHMDEERSSGIRPAEFRMTALRWYQDDTYCYAYRKKIAINAPKTTWASMKKKNRHLNYD